MSVHFGEAAVMAFMTVDAARAALGYLLGRLDEFQLSHDEGAEWDSRLAGLVTELDILRLNLYALQEAHPPPRLPKQVLR